MKGGELLDPTPLLRWVERNPDAVENWAAEKNGTHAVAIRRINACQRGALISFGVADQICCLLGVHMSEVFGSVYWEARCGAKAVCRDCGDRVSREAQRCWSCEARRRGELLAA